MLKMLKMLKNIEIASIQAPFGNESWGAPGYKPDGVGNAFPLQLQYGQRIPFVIASRRRYETGWAMPVSTGQQKC